MYNEEILILLFIIIIISFIIYITIKKVQNFNEFKKAIILQDLKLENNFNKINNKFNVIKEDTIDINNRLNDNNLDCLGQFSECEYNNNNCKKKYKIYREKKGNGKDCKYYNDYEEECKLGEGNCPSKCVGSWDLSQCNSNTNPHKKYIVSNNSNSINCIYDNIQPKHGNMINC